jgi:ABC-type transport system substrate-binding protein
MTEATAQLPAVPEATATAFAGLSPESQATAHEQLSKAGYDVSKLSVAKPAVLAPAVGEVAHKPDATLVAHWRNLYENGTLDKAMVARQAAKVGIDLTQDPAAEAAMLNVTKAAQVEAEAQAAIATPASAADYQLEWPNARDLDATALKAQDSFMRAGFHATGVPANLAQPLAQALIETAKQYISKLDPKYATDDDIEREQLAFKIKALEEGARVRALNMPDIARLAEVAMVAMPKAFRAQLENLHSMTSANAFAALAGIGRAIEARKGK